MIRSILIPALGFLTSGFVALSAAERTCRVLYLGAPKDAPQTLQLFDGKGSQEIKLPRMNLSPVYKLPSGAITLRLLEKAPGKPEDIPVGAPKAVRAVAQACAANVLAHIEARKSQLCSPAQNVLREVLLLVPLGRERLELLVRKVLRRRLHHLLILRKPKGRIISKTAPNR